MFCFVARGTEIKSDKVHRPAFYSWLFRAASVILPHMESSAYLALLLWGLINPSICTVLWTCPNEALLFNCLAALCSLLWQQRLRIGRERLLGHPRLISELCLPPPSQPRWRGHQEWQTFRLGRGFCGFLDCFLCPVAGPAREESSARLTCRLQVAVHLALTARNLI